MGIDFCCTTELQLGMKRSNLGRSRDCLMKEETGVEASSHQPGIFHNCSWQNVGANFLFNLLKKSPTKKHTTTSTPALPPQKNPNTSPKKAHKKNPQDDKKLYNKDFGL